MPQKMRRPAAGADDSRAVQGAIDDMRDGLVRRESSKRHARAYEYRRGIALWPAVLKIRGECIAELLSQGKLGSTAGFSRHLDPSAFPIDVGQAQLNDVACA